MKKITYGLMETATQKVMGGHRAGHTGAARYDINGNKPLEADDLREVVDFLHAAQTPRGSWVTNGGYDPSDFQPVAFIRETDGHRRSEDIKQVFLPEIKKITPQRTRSPKDTPSNALKRYLSAEMIDALPSMDAEFVLVTLTPGQVIEAGDAIVGSRFSTVFGEVKVSMPVPDDWPLADSAMDTSNVRLLLVDNRPERIADMASLADIEPAGPSSPKM